VYNELQPCALRDTALQHTHTVRRHFDSAVYAGFIFPKFTALFIKLRHLIQKRINKWS
jgi:hypothetical protein